MSRGTGYMAYNNHSQIDGYQISTSEMPHLESTQTYTANAYRDYKFAGFKTVLAGEKMAIWSLSGKCEVVDGPCRKWLYRKKYQKLERHTCGNDEFFILRKVDGTIAHQRGPSFVWLDPNELDSVTVAKSINITANEVLVVYRQENETGKVERRIVRGPSLFMLEPNEWLHIFRWHGTDPTNKTRKIPGALKFTKLRIIPDQFYYNVPDTRSSDDALITVKVMVFFELESIETMLDLSHDPVADMINGLCSDVIRFSAPRTYEQFLKDTSRLNDIETYQSLVTGAKRIGYKVTRVVYRGYHCSDELQRMHDNSIKERTRLHLEYETQRQAEEIEDFRVEKVAERTQKTQETERKEEEHKIAMEKAGHDEKMRQKKLEEDADLTSIQARNSENVNHYRLLSEMGIDMTKMLVAKEENIERIVRFETPSASETAIHTHIK